MALVKDMLRRVTELSDHPFRWKKLRIHCTIASMAACCSCCWRLDGLAVGVSVPMMTGIKDATTEDGMPAPVKTPTTEVEIAPSPETGTSGGEVTVAVGVSDIARVFKTTEESCPGKSAGKVVLKTSTVSEESSDDTEAGTFSAKPTAVLGELSSTVALAAPANSIAGVVNVADKPMGEDADDVGSTGDDIRVATEENVELNSDADDTVTELTAGV